MTSTIFAFFFLFTIFASLASDLQKQTGEYLESSPFSGDNDDTKWSLRVYPKGKNQENEDYLSVFLRLVSSNQPEVKARSNIFILNAKREKANAKEFQQARSFAQVRAREAEFVC